ncbi:MAG: hypothetical protein AMJ79_08015 [Phycisphaerae bacterium SM23_30]|nr:MAG: hypothetical protein AMJ79_08015 [Phycisphaerae bacterium SM23_30]
MSSLKEFAIRRPTLTSVLLWVLAVILTLGCFAYQDKTGPTYPLEGDFGTAKGTVPFKFLRSETIGKDLAIMLLDPVPEEVTGYVEYRRYKSNDALSRIDMTPGEFEFSRRGRTETVEGLGVKLPSLTERAGKYEYFVYIDDAEGEPISVTGENPIYARYKAEVPFWALAVHILVIFASMMLAIRTTLEAIIDGKYKRMLWAAIVSLLLGGFFFGPLVQLYAFGVWWSGVPFGYDWTDNKVLVELIFWLWAAFLNRSRRRNRWSVYLAGVVTLFVYFIPHSLFGSEFDYRTGTGRGTVG